MEKDHKQFIEKMFLKHSAQSIADKLQIKVWKVRHYAYSIGLKKQINKYWNSDEILILKSEYKYKGDTEIAEMLGRTKKQIEKKRKYLNLKRTTNQIRKIRGRNNVIYEHGFQKGHIPPSLRKEGEIWQRKKDKNFFTKQNGIVYKLSRWVWLSSGRKLKKGYMIVHKNKDLSNNNISNLEQIKPSENIRRNTIHRYPKELKEVIFLSSKLKRHGSKK